MISPPKKILVAMSGGVDSSVAATILKDQGYQVAGAFLRFNLQSQSNFSENKCCSTESLNLARQVADQLDIPLYLLDAASLFQEKVVNDYLLKSRNGLTPNPCVRCNQKIKFGFLVKKAVSLGFDFLATGHYAGVETAGPGFELRQAGDHHRDQSYFLYHLNQQILPYLIFPLARLTKTKVRQLAQKYALPTASRHDSQDLCFLPENDSSSFLKENLTLCPGPIQNSRGKILGQHQGLPLYTLGQRKNIRLSGGPYYVVRKVPQANSLIVTDDPQDPALQTDSATAKSASWVAKIPGRGEKVLVKTRSRQKACPAIIESADDHHFQIIFVKPQRAVTPGQSAVLYQGSSLIGGGIIVPA